ncbi:MAG: hypothetical protein E7676_05700 [Ruminococcaceae bacterium]|nr:hypothetical protein [Oscillospiraceae bacterium]
MKKLFAVILLLSTLCVSSCVPFAKGVDVEKLDDCTKITLDNFKGEKKIKVAHDSPNEGALYYKTDITDGSVKVYYDLGILWDEQKLFEADADSSAVGGGYYIDNNTAEFTVIIESDSGVSGEILLGFEPFE